VTLSGPWRDAFSRPPRLATSAQFPARTLTRPAKPRRGLRTRGAGVSY